MALDTMSGYLEKLGLPLYIKISTQGHNSWEIGKKYDIRIEDPERQEEKGGEGRYVYVHEALLIGVSEAETVEDIPDIVLAFNSCTRDRDKALEHIKSYIESEENLYILFLLRLDMAKEFIVDGLDSIPREVDVKEATEGNGYSTDIEVTPSQARSEMKQEGTYKS